MSFSSALGVIRGATFNVCEVIGSRYRCSGWTPMRSICCFFVLLCFGSAGSLGVPRQCLAGPFCSTAGIRKVRKVRVARPFWETRREPIGGLLAGAVIGQLAALQRMPHLETLALDLTRQGLAAGSGLDFLPALRDLRLTALTLKLAANRLPASAAVRPSSSDVVPGDGGWAGITNFTLPKSEPPLQWACFQTQKICFEGIFCHVILNFFKPKTPSFL